MDRGGGRGALPACGYPEASGTVFRPPDMLKGELFRGPQGWGERLEELGLTLNQPNIIKHGRRDMSHHPSPAPMPIHCRPGWGQWA